MSSENVLSCNVDAVVERRDGSSSRERARPGDPASAIRESRMGQVPFTNDGRYMGSIDASVVKECTHRTVEPDASGDCREGCCDGLRCTDCGATFTVECPD